MTVDEGAYGVRFTNIDSQVFHKAREVNPAFGRIMAEQLPAFVELFASKALDYEDDAQELGIKAQFVDINRKVGKMRRAMWDGKPLHGPEKLPEVIRDIIAHCFLALDMIDNGDPVAAGINPAALA